MLALLCGLCALAWAPASAGAVTQTFSYTGAQQTLMVPAGVSSVHVVAVGGRGGTVTGGFGAVVSGDLPVTPGEILFVEVGGNGLNGGVSSAGGFNGGGDGGPHGGGSGGGASDLRTGSASQGGSLSSRLIVAAGGGRGHGPHLPLRR